MKYILSEGELRDIKIKSERTGFNRAEDLLRKVLDGERHLLIGGEINRLTGFQELMSIYQDKNNIWAKLIERLDAKK